MMHMLRRWTLLKIGSLLLGGMLVHLAFKFLLFDPLEDQMATISATAVNPPVAQTPVGFQEKIQEYLGVLNRQPNESERVWALHQSAVNHSVKIRSAQYSRDLIDPNIRRLQITAEVVGSYPNIRHFLRELAVQDLSLSWDSLNFSKSTSEQEVRLQIRFVLFSKA